MKKILFFTMLALVMCLASCSSSDGDLDVNTSPITLYTGDSIAVSGANSIESADSFVVFGKKNYVKGFHIGQTSVKVNGKYTIPVTIKGKSTFYDDPIINWGCSQDYIKANQLQGTLSPKSTSELLFYENVGKSTNLGYGFKNGSLVYVGTLVEDAYASDFFNYLLERFFFVPEDDNGRVCFFGVNALKANKATVEDVLEVDKDDASLWINICMPISRSSSMSKIMNNLENAKMLLRR